MKIMKQVVVDFLDGKKKAKFDAIWANAKKELTPVWNEKYTNVSEKDLEKVKTGELFTMLTTNGEFIKNEKDEWTLTKFYSFVEIQKMKVNVSESED